MLHWETHAPPGVLNSTCAAQLLLQVHYQCHRDMDVNGTALQERSCACTACLYPHSAIGYVLLQDPATVLQVKQAKLQLLQQASTQQITKLLCVADPDSLAHCASIAASTGLSSALVHSIQQAQATTADMQGALEAAQLLQGSSNCNCLEAGDAAHEQLSAVLRRFEALCKPGEASEPWFVVARVLALSCGMH